MKILEDQGVMEISKVDDMPYYGKSSTFLGGRDAEALNKLSVVGYLFQETVSYSNNNWKFWITVKKPLQS